jgi:ribosomal protein L36
MKVVSSLKRICADCYFVRRGKKLYLRCTTSPRHKRRQGFSTFVMPGSGETIDESSQFEEEVHTGCFHCSKPLHFAQVLAIQNKFKETFPEKREK